ncbi:RHS repeat-associated core domain-containing protein [Pseudomonas putida]|uniref:RHS repeat-associated core domain-containing protein n=1 Tax=Pseudomonas putida TaxID=303 RepID=UPI003570E4D7
MKTAKHSLYFYQANRLIAVKQGSDHRAVFRTVAVPLAEQRSVRLGTSLLAVEGSGTVLQADCAGQRESHNYTAYGYDPKLPSPLTLLGFNGEILIVLDVDYALGQGHRCFNPVRMRFNTPDRLSPFEAGGLNAYCYCEGDPVNHVDPSGKMKKIPRSNRPSARTIPTVGNQQPNHSPSSTASSSNSVNNTVASAQARAPHKPVKQLLKQAVLGPDNPNPSPQPVWIEDSRSESVGSNVSTNPEPVAVITPVRPSPPSSHSRQQTDSPVSSANSSRDSTPAGSRSPSPSRARVPGFVQTNVDIRQSDYYSRRFDPF